MNNITTFENIEFGKLTVIEKDGEFFFLGSEVAIKLGYSNPRDAIHRHVDDEDKSDVVFHDGRQNRKMISINESGLYSLILSSKLEGAKRFKTWVTREVLPSIRKYGGYIDNQENLSNEEILAKAIKIANSVIDEKNKLIEELEPKAMYFDKLVETNLLTNLRNTAKELGVKQNEFVRFLLDNELLYRDKHGKLLPYAHKNKGYFEVKEWIKDDGNITGIQTFITPKGRNYLLLLIEGDELNE